MVQYEFEVPHAWLLISQATLMQSADKAKY
jgi:hypothetical protein